MDESRSYVTEYWERKELGGYNVDGNSINTTCVGCGNKGPLGQCSNCGNNTWDFFIERGRQSSSSPPLTCHRCEEGGDQWTCPTCGTRNPVIQETIYAEPTERESVVGSWFGCFIATAAYETEDAREVQVLRRFRDEKLQDWRYGETIIGAYQRLSPPVARWISDKPTARLVTRKFLLAPVVWVVNKVMKQTDRPNREY